jgi:hypothetical protein
MGQVRQWVRDELHVRHTGLQLRHCWIWALAYWPGEQVRMHFLKVKSRNNDCRGLQDVQFVELLMHYMQLLLQGEHAFKVVK